MAGLTNNIATALATAAATTPSVTGASAVPIEGVPGTPYIYVGPPKIQITPGSWDTRIYQFPMHYLIARVAEPIDQTAINDALDAVLTVFRTGITLGLTNPQPIALIVAADTDKFYSLDGTDYQSIDFTVAVEVYGPQSYTA